MRNIILFWSTTAIYWSFCYRAYPTFTERGTDHLKQNGEQVPNTKVGLLVRIKQQENSYNSWKAGNSCHWETLSKTEASNCYKRYPSAQRTCSSREEAAEGHASRVWSSFLAAYATLWQERRARAKMNCSETEMKGSTEVQKCWTWQNCKIRLLLFPK